jgi:hypothetical protein
MKNINTVTWSYDELRTPPIKCGYKVELLNDNNVIFVPLDTANTDYQEIQEWIAEGGTVIDNGGNN